MSLLDLFKKAKFSTIKKVDEPKPAPEPEVPDGMFEKCPACGKSVIAEKFKANFQICPECGGYRRMSAAERLDSVCDSFTSMFEDITSKNPLDFPGYSEKIAKLTEKTGMSEAVQCVRGTVCGIDAAIAAMDSRFIMASMGSAVGERLARLAEYAAEEKLPLIIFACSGGARMQEGIFSLMQMAKVSAALAKLNEAGQLYISVLTDPTTGGVTASFAMLGDIIISEPHAIVGFAGRRVIEGTIGEKLPENFQTAEFIKEHGFCDMITDRKDMKSTLGKLLELHGYTPGRAQNEA